MSEILKKQILNKINLFTKSKFSNFSYNQENDFGSNPLMFILSSYDYKFNLTQEEFDFLLLNTNLKEQNKHKLNVLMIFLGFLNEDAIKYFNEKNIDFLINNSDINQVDRDNWNSFIYYLKFNKRINYIPNKEKLFNFFLENQIKEKNKTINAKILDIMLYDDKVTKECISFIKNIKHDIFESYYLKLFTFSLTKNNFLINFSFEEINFFYKNISKDLKNSLNKIMENKLNTSFYNNYQDYLKYKEKSKLTELITNNNNSKSILKL